MTGAGFPQPALVDPAQFLHGIIWQLHLFSLGRRHLTVMGVQLDGEVGSGGWALHEPSSIHPCAMGYLLQQLPPSICALTIDGCQQAPLPVVI